MKQDRERGRSAMNRGLCLGELEWTVTRDYLMGASALVDARRDESKGEDIASNVLQVVGSTVEGKSGPTGAMKVEAAITLDEAHQLDQVRQLGMAQRQG
jgi:hypothetical protein